MSLVSVDRYRSSSSWTSDETGARSGRLSKMLCEDEMDCQQCKLPKKLKAKDYVPSLQNPQQCSCRHHHCHCQDVPKHMNDGTPRGQCGRQPQPSLLPSLDS